MAIQRTFDCIDVLSELPIQVRITEFEYHCNATEIHAVSFGCCYRRGIPIDEELPSTGKLDSNDREDDTAADANGLSPLRNIMDTVEEISWKLQLFDSSTKTLKDTATASREPWLY